MIEDALEKYPIQVPLRDGSDCLIRPLHSADAKNYQEFLKAVPAEELQFIQHRITDQSRCHQWPDQVDFDSDLPLLAFLDEELVGDATLHQRRGGWKRHIGLVSVLIHPDFRDRGIIEHLIDELIEVGRHAGLTKLEAEFNGDRTRSIHGLALCGFRELVRIPDYVQDPMSSAHDYVLMGMDLIPDEDLLGAGD